MTTAGAHREDVNFVDVLRDHRVQLSAFCALFADDHDERDELAQLVMIRVWKGFGRFDRRASFGTWLYAIVRNTALSERRRRARRPVPVEVTDGVVPLIPGQRWVGPESAALGRDAIRHALAALDEPFRTAFELIEVWGYGYADAAEVIGAPAATLRTRVWRARREIRARCPEVA